MLRVSLEALISAEVYFVCLLLMCDISVTQSTDFTKWVHNSFLKSDFEGRCFPVLLVTAITVI